MIGKKILVINTGYSGQINKEKEAPKWFSYPFEQVYDDVIYSKNPFLEIVSLLKARFLKSINFSVDLLIFNPSLSSLMCSLLFPRRTVKIICLYQWIWEGAPFLKRGAIYAMLLRANKVFVYDRLNENLLSSVFGIKKKLVRYPIYTDRSFFSKIPEVNKKSSILVVGDHLRDDALLRELAIKLNEYKFVRVTRNDISKDIVFSDNVLVERGVSFKRLKELYSESAVCLVLTCETRFPVGITAIAEAISAGVPVLATNGAGVGFFNETKNIKFYNRGESSDQLVTWIKELESQSDQVEDTQNLKWLDGEHCIEIIESIQK